ncbi:hypothetical protein [Arthrobacter sp. KNU40]|uniref:hypothetical protein n=1 Tax=Arthrobacter sp. KNU40 TaxID=3447965 RepID=UPI003F63545D
MLVEILRMRDNRDQVESSLIDRQRWFIEVLQRNSGEPGLIRLYVTTAAKAADPDHAAAKFFGTRFEVLSSEIANKLPSEVSEPTHDDALGPALKPNLSSP